MTVENLSTWLTTISWNEQGLLPVIVQDIKTQRVLMFAWMNQEALLKTIELKEAVFFSRSRQRLWHKGETSGHTQRVHDIRLDCDADVLLLMVEQVGGIACHTGRYSCFFKTFQGTLTEGQWCISDAILKDPEQIYS